MLDFPTIFSNKKQQLGFFRLAAWFYEFETRMLSNQKTKSSQQYKLPEKTTGKVLGVGRRALQQGETV